MGGEGVVLYTPSGSGVDRETALSWDLPNFDQQLIDTLSEQNQNKSVLVLFDGADQTYRKEDSIPKLSPLDRPRFVKRKLELAFPSYPIRASFEIKPPKVKGQRRTALPSYLFVALPETEHVDRVGNALLESGVPVAGFGLLPAESAGLVSELAGRAFGTKGKSQSRWAILVGQHETGGLRQVVVKDGNLALTRLTPVSEGGVSGAGWAEEVQREFRATLTYVSRFGYHPNDGLDVIVIADDISRQFFDAKTIGVENFKCMSVSDALKLIGAKSFGLDKTNFADALHAAWSGRKGGLKLPIRVPSIHRIMAPRLTARLAGFGMMVSVLALGFMLATTLQSASGLRDEIAQKQTQKTMLEREYETEAKVFDTLPVKADILKGTMQTKELLEQNTVRVAPMLHRLKAALGNDIYLSEVRYEHAPGPMLPLSGGPVDPTRPPSPPKDGKVDRGTIKIGFKFALPNNMPLEQKVIRAENLQTTLRNIFPGFDVRILSQFGKVSRDGRFEGSLGGESRGAATGEDLAEFELEGAPL